MTATKTMIPTTRISKKTNYKALEGGQYPARLVRFIGLGIQEQPEFKGEKKRPAFKVALQWELYNPNTMEALNAIEFKNEEDGTITEVVTDRPSCVFQDMFLFPNAERGKVFDLSKAFDPTLKKTSADLDWFFDQLGKAATVTLSKYQKKDGTFGNGVQGGGTAILPMMANMMKAARSELVQFNPYTDDMVAKKAYAQLFPFQRTMLTEAKDANLIPLAGSEPIQLEGVNAEAKNEVIDEEVPFDTAPAEVNPFA